MNIKKIKNLKTQIYSTIGIFSVVIIFIGSMLLCFAKDKPRLIFDEYLKDLGEVQERASPEVVFTFRNKGNKQLVIYELESSCNCQNLKVTKSKIAPGEVGELHANLLPETKGGPATDIIYVKSNDSEQPIQAVRIKRFVIKHTVIEPNKLIIENFDDSHTSIRKVTILGPTGNHDFKILKVETDDKRIAADFTSLDRTPDDRPRWELKVTIKWDEVYSTKETKKVTIFTSDKKKPAITLPVIIEENIPVKLTPKSLSFIIGGSPQLQKMQIRVTYLGKTDYVNLQPDVNMPDYVRITQLSTKSNSSCKEWTYEVEIDEDAKLKTPIQIGQIEFSFSAVHISVSLPISVLKLRANSAQGSQTHVFPKLDLGGCITKGIGNRSQGKYADFELLWTIGLTISPKNLIFK